MLEHYTAQEKDAEIARLGTVLFDLVKRAVKASPDPLLAYKMVPETLAGMAGSNTGVMMRNGLLADGEGDKHLARLHARMDQHAMHSAAQETDESLNMHHLRARK